MTSVADTFLEAAEALAERVHRCAVGVHHGGLAPADHAAETKLYAEAADVMVRAAVELASATNAVGLAIDRAREEAR